LHLTISRSPPVEESRNCGEVSRSISDPQQILPLLAVALEAQALSDPKRREHASRSSYIHPIYLQFAIRGCVSAIHAPRAKLMKEPAPKPGRKPGSARFATY
jgi:hypothetical protein